jgi:hypothetical protein
VRDVREIFERVLDEPQPPLRATAEITGAARRVARRRDRLTAAGSVAAVLVATLAGVLVARTPPEARPGLPSVAPAVSASFRPLPAMPSLHAIDDHTAQAAAVLGAAVPAGLAAGQPEAQYGWATVLHDGEYVTSVRLEMTFATGGGWLEVRYVFDAGLADPACSDAALTATARAEPGADQGCQVRTVGGTAVQVTTGPGIVAGVRFLRGGFVCVAVRQGTLGGPPLRADRVAALAADPGLLP